MILRGAVKATFTAFERGKHMALDWRFSSFPDDAVSKACARNICNQCITSVTRFCVLVLPACSRHARACACEISLRVCGCVRACVCVCVVPHGLLARLRGAHVGNVHVLRTSCTLYCK